MTKLEKAAAAADKLYDKQLAEIQAEFKAGKITQRMALDAIQYIGQQREKKIAKAVRANLKRFIREGS